MFLGFDDVSGGLHIWPYSLHFNKCILQAQTVANFFLAFDQNLAIVPVLNKIDMSSADPDKVADEMHQVSCMT